MTQPRAHLFRIDDREWFIRAWNGPRDVIPESEALGFATRMRSTADYAGRADTFVVDGGRLRLHMIEAHLTDEHRDFVPPDGRREDVTTRDWATMFRDGKPTREIFARSEVRLYFEALWIPFTGRIALARTGQDLTLAFDDGQLVGRSKPSDSVPDE